MNPLVALALKEAVAYLESHPEEVAKLVQGAMAAILAWLQQQLPAAPSNVPLPGHPAATEAR